MTKNTALEYLWCTGNQLTAARLGVLFGTLHSNAGSKTIVIDENPGTDDCDCSIVTDKGWTVGTVN